MNRVNTTSRFLIMLTMLFSFNAFAETMPFKVVETFSLGIKLSSDGSGIIKNVYCAGCTFKYLKITEQTKASEKGVDVDIQQAKAQAGKFATVSFNPQTLEVQYIRW